MKSLKTLTLSVLLELGALCDTAVDRDLTRIAARCEDEGEAFLTITLPNFCKCFERSLAVGSIASVSFDGFAKRGGFPLFMGGLLRLVFSDEDGSLLDEPSIDAIQGIRQVALLHSKIFEVCDQKRAANSIESYVECERLLHESWYDPRLIKELRATATQVFGSQLRDIEESCASGTLVPRHGPGSTADRLSGNGKWDSGYWPVRLDAEFPVADYLLPGYSFYEELSHVEMPEPADETPVKVVTVPKTAAKARVIAMEPTNVQYVQQALLGEFTRVFSRGSAFVDLTDQQLNRRMARDGSRDGSLATLDLSEASDRVSVEVVEAVFGNYPKLLAALTSSRSLRSSLPDGRVISLAKFASMGSATCFPVESIVFATIALNAIRKSLNEPVLRQARIRELAKTTRVFGDDIIVPTAHVQHVLRDLASLGAKPNNHKSFWTGKFRESCGGDYFAGHDVSVTRLRRRLPETRHDSSELLALVAFRNHMYMRGFWNTCAKVDVGIEKMIPMPIVEQSSPVCGRWSVAFKPQTQRHHPNYQSPLVKGLVVRSVSPYSESSGSGKLLKCTLPNRYEPFAEENHLTRSGRPDRVRTKIGWGSPA